MFLVQTGAEKEAEYPNVPLMHELGRNDEERAILELISSPAALGRPFFLPPDVPADRVAALRKAFAATMKDPDYIAEGNRVRLDTNPLGAEHVTQLVRATVYAPPGMWRRRAPRSAPRQEEASGSEPVRAPASKRRRCGDRSAYRRSGR